MTILPTNHKPHTTNNPAAFRFHLILLAAIILLSGIWRIAYLNDEFNRDGEGCGAFFGLLARNYFRYDFSATRGVPIMAMGQGAAPLPYAHHSPVTPLLIAAVYKITGYHGGYDALPADWQIRLPTTLFTLACIAAIYQLVAMRAGPRAGLIAACAFAALPMTLIFGGFPDVISPQLLFFALLTVHQYEHYQQHNDRRAFVLMCLCFTGAGLVDWPAFYLVPVLGLHFVCTTPPRRWPWMIGFGLFSVALFAALYSYLAIAQHDWRWMGELLHHRALSTNEDAAGAFTFGHWFARAVWKYAVGRHTLAVLLLALAWAGIAVWRRFRGAGDRFTALLMSWALLHVLIGRQGVYQHEWWWWPLAPAVAIAAALAIERIAVALESIELHRWVLNICIACAAVAFFAVNMNRAYHERHDADPLQYSLKEIGDAIRAAAPPDQAVMVAESDNSLAFWHYADRALKRNIWDEPSLDKRLSDGWVEASFDQTQRWPGPVGAMVIPKAYIPFIPTAFIDALDARYPRRESEKFITYKIGVGGRE